MLYGTSQWFHVDLHYERRNLIATIVPMYLVNFLDRWLPLLLYLASTLQSRLTF